MHTIQFSSFLPIPEIVTRGSDLREGLRFLSARESLWEKFRETLSARENLDTGRFVIGFGRLVWRLRGEQLPVSVHQARLSRTHRMAHRMPLPLVARKLTRTAVDAVHLHIIHEVRVYPTLYSEQRVKIIAPGRETIPEQVARDIFPEIRQMYSRMRATLSKALFGCRETIGASPSSWFTIDIRGGRGSTGKRRRAVTIKATPDNTRFNVTLGEYERVFARRAAEAVAVALAHRTVSPALWSAFVNPECDIRSRREIIECILVAQNPDYHERSKRETPHILSHYYQRDIYEYVAGRFQLDRMYQRFTRQFVETLCGLPLADALYLSQATPPLGGLILTTLARRCEKQERPPALTGPTKAILHYLILAYARDSRLVREDPQRYRIPEERVGLRTANKIHNGASRLEAAYSQEYTPRHSKEDIYEVPGRVLSSLLEMGLIEMREYKRTSASVAFRVRPENPMVRQVTLDLMTAFPGSIAEYGE